jgi:Flp pilus assembly protein TadG
MARATARERTRRNDESGNALVEFVIVLPIVVALVLGVMSFGTTHEQKLSLTNAAREGARYGATLPSSTPNWAGLVQNVVVASATGDLDTAVPGRSICVALNNGSTWSGTANAPCFSDGRPANEARVQVLVSRSGKLDTFFFSRTTTLTGRAVVRFEAGS